jgi:hypothetical protein
LVLGAASRSASREQGWEFQDQESNMQISSWPSFENM